MSIRSHHRRRNQFCVLAIAAIAVFTLLPAASAWMSPATMRPRRSSRVQSQVASTESISTLAELDEITHWPKLIVLDLDNTLWTPELYQIRQKTPPIPGKDIQLFPDAAKILKFWKDKCPPSRLAIASRTNKGNWARQLLEGFRVDDEPISNLFDFVEIQTGSKKEHFARLKQNADVAFHHMLFVDDARMNLGEISQMGVLCTHTPHGITIDHFVRSIQKYNELKEEHVDGHWMGYILNSENLDIPKPETPGAGVRMSGRVKFYSSQKRFGFVVDDASRQEFFVHESKVPAEVELQTGDKVEFESLEPDSRGRLAAAILGVNGAAAKPSASFDGATMPCFTMSQPFAALLLNRVKTVESRNNPMFMDLEPGTRVLLHCGRKDWHDTQSFREIMATGGYSDKDIEQLSRLPKGMKRGEIVGILTVGQTKKMGPTQKATSTLQWKVLAPEDGIGNFCTEVYDVSWLKRSVSRKGQPGIYDVTVPVDALP